MPEITPTPRTTLKRVPARGSHDRDEIHAILDEGFICHLGTTHAGHAAVIPTVYARSGDSVYIHGSTANRILRSVRDGAEACLVVTHVDGLVLSRAAFHTSVNYRSVVLYAHGHEVTDPDEKLEALRITVEHAIPERWKDIRHPNREEFLRTMVLELPLQEASAKIRTGGPVEEPEDYERQGWAGVLPLKLQAQTPIDDDRLAPGIVPPHYIAEYRRP